MSAPLFVLLAAIGAARFYSPVPFLDMWPGTVEWYLRVRGGDWAAWWGMHHEHRIMLSRLLFWIDMAWLDGRMWFLVVANFLIAGGIWFTWRAILRAHPIAVSRKLRTLLLLFMGVCLFSWAQRDNFFWAFQSQFFLAQWLPLLALFALYRAVADPRTRDRWFAAATALGVLCIGTMANGVLALPVLAAYSACVGLGWRRTLLLAALGAACAFLYFAGFRPVAAHGEFGTAAWRQPLALVEYVLAFLGSPFFAYSGYGALRFTQATGLALVALMAAKAWQVLRQPQADPFALFLLAYFGFILATAAGTGAGRLALGVEQAVTGRYSTPAIMAWLAALLLYLRPVAAAFAQRPVRVLVPLLALLAAMWPLQIKALASQRDALFEWEVAALALELGVRDDPQLRRLFPQPDRLAAIAQEAARQDVSVFGRGPIRDAGALMGRQAAQVAPFACSGRVDLVQPVTDDPRYLRVAGTAAMEPTRGRRALALADAQGVVAGYVLAAEPQPGTPRGVRSFKGYALASAGTPAFSVAAMSKKDCPAAIGAGTRDVPRE